MCFVCVCVCVCYVYVFECAGGYVYIHTVYVLCGCVHVPVMCMYVLECTCMPCVFTCIFTCVGEHVPTHVRVHVCVYMSESWAGPGNEAKWSGTRLLDIAVWRFVCLLENLPVRPYIMTMSQWTHLGQSDKGVIV